MTRLIKPSRVSGSLRAPSSKSFAIRALAASLLSENHIIIKNPSYCSDVLSAISIIEKLGCVASKSQNGLEISARPERGRSHLLNCGESGLCMRMFSPIVTLFNSAFTLDAEGSLKKRSVSQVSNGLSDLGVECKTNNGFPPIHINGKITNNSITIDGSHTSQFLTGLLMTLPLLNKNSTIVVNNLASKPYIDMTLDLLTDFGIMVKNENYNRFFIAGNQRYSASEYTVPGDYSGASFLLVAGAIAGEISVSGLNPESKQADAVIIDILKNVGASVSICNDTIKVGRNELNGFTYDATDSPDLFPPLVALGVACEGMTTIYGVDRLRDKESSRADVLQREFAKLGAKIDICGNKMNVFSSKIKGGKIDSHNDHRIAMAGALLGLISENGVYIDDSECVKKSYPDFFSDLDEIRHGK